MDGLGIVDLYSTKGLEYLLVIGFLLLFTIVWVFLSREERPASAVAPRRLRGSEWFRLDEGRFYHQGHTWARPEASGIVSVGIDDFAQKLLGRPSSLNLPKVGARVTEGEQGWNVSTRSGSVDMLSPVTGQVVAVNPDVLKSPELLEQDPYESWLVRVQVPRMRPALRNLLSGKLANAWMEETVATLRERMAGNLGTVLQDGGEPVSGFAANLAPEDWEAFAAEFLLTN